MSDCQHCGACHRGLPFSMHLLQLTPQSLNQQLSNSATPWCVIWGSWSWRKLAIREIRPIILALRGCFTSITDHKQNLITCPVAVRGDSNGAQISSTLCRKLPCYGLHLWAGKAPLLLQFMHCSDSDADKTHFLYMCLDQTGKPSNALLAVCLLCAQEHMHVTVRLHNACCCSAFGLVKICPLQDTEWQFKLRHGNS